MNCNQIVALAAEGAHSPGKFEQGQALLNSVLNDVAQIYDMAAARGQYVFSFNLNLGSIPRELPASTLPYTQFGSGPYYMPVDYLRLSGSSGSTGAQRSFIWYLNGVPFPVIPCDLAEFDLQVQQSGLQSYVWLGASDMSAPIDDRILLTTTGNIVKDSTTITQLGSTNRLIAGLGLAGQGIVAGSTVVSVNTAANTLVMSNPGVIDVSQSTMMFGYPPSVWIYPPPSSAQQAMIRYQRRMPPITDFSRFPWFDFDGYLIKEVQARLEDLNDDSRSAQHHAEAMRMLTLWLSSKDDEASHPKTVQLDRRRFGNQWGKLKTTKFVGWC